MRKNRLTAGLFILLITLLSLPLTAPAPPGTGWFPSWTTQVGAGIPELSGHALKFDRGYIMVVDNPANFKKIISMDRNFSKGQKLQVKFSDRETLKILMSDGKTVKILFLRDGEWGHVKTADRSVW